MALMAPAMAAEKPADLWILRPMAKAPVPKISTHSSNPIDAFVAEQYRQKGLKPVAQSLLGVGPWGIDTRDLLSKPLDEILHYNAKDTFYTDLTGYDTAKARGVVYVKKTF